MRRNRLAWAIVVVAATVLAGAALPASAARSGETPRALTARSGAVRASEPKGVKAVVVKSWSDCSSGSVIWDTLNANWSSYGSVPISIDYSDPDVCGASFDLAGLEASGADVVILDNPAGFGKQFTPAEVSALRSYSNEGHDLIGTYLTFWWDFGGTSINNAGLAPLFGLVKDDGWAGGDNDTRATYALKTHKSLAKRLIRNLPNPFVSTGYQSSQVPGDGAWSLNDLAGATLVGLNLDQESAMTVFRAKTYRAIYIASMPEYGGGSDDQQFFYNAIIYPKIG